MILEEEELNEAYSEYEKNVLQSLLNEYKDIVLTGPMDVGNTDLVQHEIHTTDDVPVRVYGRRKSPAENKYINEEVDKMLKAGIIEPSKSHYAAPVVLVKKKDGTLRFAVNYKGLNDKVKQIQYPLPNIEECLDQFGGALVFSTLDLAQAFYQVMIKPEHKHKTAFQTESGFYQFRVMPFGLNNSPATFQTLMNEVLRPFLRKFVVVYLDDIIIFSKSIKEHIKHLNMVFKRLREVKLKIKPSKCEFFKKELKFLGYRVSKDGIHTDPSNTIKIQKVTPPRNEKETRGFLGLCQFYRKFIQNFQKIAEPLYKLLRSDEKYYQQVWTRTGWKQQQIEEPTWNDKWQHEQQQAFEELKHRLITAPVLAHPDFDKPFILYTDASTIGLGAVLAQQQDDGKERPIAYHARTLKGAEKNYPITELECLAVIWAIVKLRHYLQNNHTFTLYTDHIALKNLKGHTNPSKRRMRWIETLA